MQTNAPSLGSVTLTYIAYYLGLTALMVAVVLAAEYFAGFTIEGNSVGWLPAILAALMAGQSYGAKTGGKPPQSFSWMAGLMFLLASIVISAAVGYAFALLMAINMAGTMAQLQAEIGGDMGLFVAIMGGFLLILLVALRFMFSIGAGQGAKQAELRRK